MPHGNNAAVAASRRLGRALDEATHAAFVRDCPDEWMDAMIDLFLIETERQFKSLKTGSPDESRARVDSARALQTLERTLERLAQFQSTRRGRERKVAMSDDELRAEIERRLDKRLGEAPTQRPAEAGES